MKRRFFIKNLIMFLIPVLVPLIILGSLAILISQNYIKNEINKNNISMLKQTQENIELMLNELDPLTLSFSNSVEITNAIDPLFKNSTLTLQDIISNNLIKNFLNAPANTRPYIHSIDVYIENKQGNFFASPVGLANLNDYYDNEWYISYLKHNSNSQIWTEERFLKQYKFEVSPTKIISIFKSMSPKKGVIVLNLYPDYIQKILNTLAVLPEQCILVLNENNKIIFSNSTPAYLKEINIEKLSEEKQPLFSTSSSRETFIISQLQSQHYGWKYISIVPQRTMYTIPVKFGILTLLSLIVSFILALGLTYFFTNKNYKQINNIISILDSAECGKPLPALPERITDEYGYIINNIIKTFIEHSFLKVQLSERKYKEKVLELLALQSQINPHFLFNTLKTIYWKSVGLTGNQNEVSDMIENLSDILNYSLGNPDSLVTLETEIRTTKSYIEIQKIRYKDKFDVIWEYEPEVTQYKTLKLLLQPLIENSIYHGIKEKECKGIIKIKIYKMQNTLRLVVIDNGIGMNKQSLGQINQRRNEDREFSEHIGLFNTNKRIMLTYGEDCGIKIRSKSGVGTAIYINLPL